MKTYTRTKSYRCPQCHPDSDLEYVTVPEYTRQYTDTDGEEVNEYFDESKDFSCRNCGCEFTLTCQGG